MGHRAVQRVVVRFLYDDAFAAAAHERPAEVLGAAGLDAEEQAQVLAIDRRAWRTDPLRRRRTLRTLVEEFKIATTLAFAETRSLAFVEGFFASAEFHGAIHERRSLALAYGDFLANAQRAGRLTTPQLADVVRLESAMARCRRPAPRAPAGAPAAKAPPRFVLAPGIEVDAFEANVIETIHRVEQYLFEVGLMPMVALCDDAPRITALPPPAKERIHLLLRAAGRDVDMTYLEESTFRVLREATEPRTAEQIAGRLGPGAPLAATRNALETLAGEGILVRLP